MYALPNKTQHKIIVKVRGGDKESILNRHIDDTGFSAELSNLPQPIFHSITNHGNKQKPSSLQKAALRQQYISPQHNEMIRYVQKSWKGVERDYKKSVNNFINNIDLNNSSTDPISSSQKQKKKPTASSSTPLLLTGPYHHTASAQRSSNPSRQDSFKPFDLETFWGNRILKRLTEEL